MRLCIRRASDLVVREALAAAPADSMSSGWFAQLRCHGSLAADGRASHEPTS